ncbi:hypothetical protein MSG28_006296 [Choristoneura fumiferana]|uniref:Uncharacterized protein n=1 Tax=Choristoneura fumiferana TaxID=7141 RepID=A0ACC0JED7_CHOFU|nr:hypothetical protein MSG28_006296 [Choristoneura fumiferana]
MDRNIGQFGPFKQDFDYVTVRRGAHMFYWLFYTTADVPNYTERPLIVWLQGGPGGSSTGIGNFEILGPLDLSLQERNYTWVNNFNVLFVDNPVGTGYSYVDDWSYYTTTNDQIAVDFVNLMRGFYESHPEFEGVPLYIYGQSYGGKMAVDMGLRMHEAEQAQTIRSNLRGIAMGNAWIHPVDLTLTWGPLLLAAGLVDDAGYENIQKAAREAERLFNEGLYVESTLQWAATQREVFAATHNVDFYNILTKMPAWGPETRSDYEIAREIMIRDLSFTSMTRQEEYNLNYLMNNPVKEALRIPAHVRWGSQSGRVFDMLRGDFMKPVTEGKLNSRSIGDVENTAAVTRIRRSGDMFWWFFPSHAEEPTSRPIILWLDGVTGAPPSLLANFGMFGPYDFNLNKRNESWVDQYNLLFVDAPLGTGFSAAQSDSSIPNTLEENIDHLMFTLESFYSMHGGYEDTPLYIFGQGHGSQLGLALALRLTGENEIAFTHNLSGIVIANGIVSPALALTKLSFYLWELGYVDENGREAIERFSKETTDLVNNGQLGAAFDHFLSLGEYTNEIVGAAAVNLGHIVEKLPRDARQGYFGQQEYLNRMFDIDTSRFMDTTVASALGISRGSYGARQNAALLAFRIEYILQNTDLSVTIYNGNLDAVSNTPGQLEWVNALQWPGQQAFLSSPRQTLIVNRQLWTLLISCEASMSRIRSSREYRFTFTGSPMVEKMAVDMGLRMHEAEQAQTIRSNLRGIAMGNAWIHPVDLTLTWGPLLLAAGLVDDAGYENIQKAAREAERLFNEGLYVESTLQWAATQREVFAATHNVDFYNILTKMPAWGPETRSDYEIAREIMIRDLSFTSMTRQEEYNLNYLMNNPVKEALRIPAHVRWGSQSGRVFDMLRGDFMKPVTEGIERLLNETDIIVQKYNGNLDLICDTPELNSRSIGDVENTAAVTRIRRSGDMFWWFFPSHAEEPTSRPIILWLDGVTGAPPSLLANFGMFGPYDFNLNKRNESWVDQYNLLFVDAPLGTGFSAAQSDSSIPNTLEENIDHLMFTLESFYSMHDGYEDTPLYIFGQGHGSQLGLALALRLTGENEIAFTHNLSGIVIANGIVSPALALTKLSFYLWELGYVDENGREAIERFSKETTDLVNNGQLGAAFDHFLSLGEYTNEIVGAAAVNLGHIVEKLPRDARQGYFGQQEYLNRMFDIDTSRFMDTTVASALGISRGSYGARQNAALRAFRSSFMEPDTNKIEYILQNTDLSVTIYNGNLDAVSNTPGQLEWVNALQWPGQQAFLSSPRQTLIVNRQVQGYFRETDRFAFYWINAAGQSARNFNNF